MPPTGMPFTMSIRYGPVYEKRPNTALTHPSCSSILTNVRAGPARQDSSNPARAEKQQRLGDVPGCRRYPARILIPLSVRYVGENSEPVLQRILVKISIALRLSLLSGLKFSSVLLRARQSCAGTEKDNFKQPHSYLPNKPAIRQKTCII